MVEASTELVRASMKVVEASAEAASIRVVDTSVGGFIEALELFILEYTEFRVSFHQHQE